MKFSALAIDYDGTIAVDGNMNPDVRHAIADARIRGIAVILVTGRRLDDLRRVAGDLTCFDVVVAENGAVLEFPTRLRHVRLASPPPPAFINALQQEGVSFTAGECLIEADASAAPTALAVLRRLELPLTLVFNRSRLMMLPLGVAKSTGLRQALRALRISIHNTVGIGDAENDHDLLDACEVGVAVGWGSAALRAVADEVVFGGDPGALAPYIRRLSAHARLSSAQMGRRRMFLGHEPGGEPVRLALRGRNILVAGEPGTGKSWLTGLICEQLILQGYCVCVIDPEGDYRPLSSLPDVIRLGGDDPPPTPREVARALRHPDASVVIDLSRSDRSRKADYVRGLLRLLKHLRRRMGLPHKIVLDEAHYFLGGVENPPLIDHELAGYVLVTYRLSQLDATLRVACDTVALITREGDETELDAIMAICESGLLGADARRVLSTLKPNEAVLLPGCDEASGVIRRFQMAPRLTDHVRHRMKYLDMPVGEDEAFVFTEGGRSVAHARSLKEFLAIIDGPIRGLDQHAARHDFSHWVADVFRDRPLAARLRSIEEAGAPAEMASLLGQAIRARYQLGSDDVLVPEAGIPVPV